MTVAAIGLGGNLGDPHRTMATALEKLAARPGIRVLQVSGLYETPPWGKADQPVFLNAAARILTDGTARGLLDALLAVESELGRRRDERWGPRSIDLDILLFGDQAVDEPGLHIPHPRLTERAFALMPLAEVLPEARIAGCTVAHWIETAETAGIVRIAGPEWYSGAA